MTIPVQCPACLKEYGLRDDLEGKRVRCKECGENISVPRLRTINGNAAETARRATTKSTPAKPKPTTKPKPAATRHNDDDLVLEDDDEFDEFDDAEELDSVSEFRSTPRHPTRKKKPKKASSSPGSGWIAAMWGLLTSDVTGVALFVLGIGIFAVMANLQPMQANMDRSQWLLFSAGISLFLPANLWMTVRMWKVNRQWAVLFLGSGGMLRAMATALPNGVVIAIEILRFLFLIAFVVEHWDEVRAPVIAFTLGLCLTVAGGMGLFKGGPPQFAGNRGALPVPAPGIPAMNGRVPAVVPNGQGASNNPISDIANVNPFPVESIQIPELPEFSLGPMARGETFQDPQVTYQRLFFITGTSNSKLVGTVPGTNTAMVYLEPKGSHAPQSLSCVLIASAGSNLLEGRACPNQDDLNEMLPYVKAGFAVLGFSLDGYTTGALKLSQEQQMGVNYVQFQKAQAGLVNVRNVVEFASKKIPQVNSQRLFIAGHSSAATLALLAAAHEPRLKGVVAYAPATNVVTGLRDVISAPGVDRILPGLQQFATQSSPLSHVSRVNCPVFLFHATDDSNISVLDSRLFADRLKQNGKPVEYVEVPTGNHYDSMIQQGIPRAIPWLKQLANQADSNSAPVVAQNQPVQNAGMTPVPMVPLAPLTNLPQNLTAGGQPSGRVVRFRFQSFGGNGDAAAAARQALRGVTWADPNDIEVDAAKGEIRIGQLGGSVNTGAAQQTLSSAGFQMLPGVSIGSKSALVAAVQSPPISNQKVDRAKPVTVPSQEIPDVPVNKPPVNAETPKSKPTPVTPPSNPPEKRPEREKARRVVTFKYERFTGKGSSANAMKEALKRVDWADQNDVVIDATKKEIRIGLLAESPNFDQARKSLTTQGFVVAPGVTTATTKD